MVVGSFQYFAYYILDLPVSSEIPDKSTLQSVVVLSFTLLGTVLLLAVFLKYIDKKSFKELGLYPYKALPDTFTGIWLGFAVMVVALITLLWADEVQVGGVHYNAEELMLSIVLYILVSWNEELLVRGYILQNLMRSFHPYIALLLSSALFSAMHLANPSMNWSGALSLLLAGILLGLCYLRTKSLWLPIALHFSWNFFQALLGFHVSGNAHYSLINLVYDEENIWNGGSFGFEGSVLGSIYQLPIMMYILVKYRRNSQVQGSGKVEINPPFQAET